MMPNPPIAANGNTSFSLSAAARFWERGRLFYNLVLIATAIFWIVSSWPHFRPALTLASLGKVLILALLANLCYCAAYCLDLAIQQLPNAKWRRFRWILWLLGTLFAMVIASYWINDEIYPDFPNAAIVFLRSVTLC